LIRSCSFDANSAAAPEAAGDRPERTCKVRPYRQIIDGLVAACDHVNATRQRQRADILLQQQHRTSRQPPARQRKNGTRAIDADQADRQRAQLGEKASRAAADIGERAKLQAETPHTVAERALQRRECEITDEKIVDVSEGGIGCGALTAGMRGNRRRALAASFAFATPAYHPASWHSPLAKLLRFDRFATLRVVMKVHHNR